MPASGSNSTDLYLMIDECGSWSASIPYAMEATVGNRETTNILELAITRATEWFIKEYMPLRFNPGYARGMLGYTVLNATYKKKQRRSERLYKDAILPNVWTGKTREAALAAYPETVAKGGRKSMRVGCKIRMNLPGYVNNQAYQVTNKSIRKITAQEGSRIATVFFEEVAKIMSNVQSAVDPKSRQGKIVLRASEADRAEFGRQSRQTIIMTRKQGAANVG